MQTNLTTYENEFLTLAEAAQVLKAPISSIKRLVEKGQLPIVKLTRKCTRVSRTDLMHTINEQRLVYKNDHTK